MVGDDAIPPAMLPPPPCLHDCLALGQIEVGLPRIPPSSDSKNTSTSATENGAASPAAAGAAANTASSSSSNRQNEEIRRLPLLLRWLEQSRPLTLIPTLVGLEEHAAIDDDDDNGSPEERDELIEEAVARLEDRAALFSKAEPVQRVACQLAPSACLRIRRLPPLSRRRRRPQQDAEWYYETTQLQAIALDPLKSAAAAAAAAVNAKGLKKLRRLSGATQTEALDGNGPDELQGRSDSSDNYYEDDLDELGGKEISMDVPSTMSNPDGQNSKTKKRKKQDRRIRTSLELANASEDSLDYMVLKTLQELTRLTVDSLQANASLFLSTEDSILAEPARQQGIGGGGTTSRDLGAILASLMVHAPVLRHEHVASALCRSAVPQATALIACMGANCPSAVPALLHGCISVYCGAFGGKSPAIVAVSVQAVRELANLSPREAHRALAMINRFRRSQSSSFGFMIELQLELSMKHDWIAACYILIYPYSFGKGTADTHFGKDFTNSVDEVRAKGGYMAWKSESFGNDLSEQKPNSILSHLEENLELFDQTLIFLADSLDPDSMLSSRAVIYLRAYTSVITFASLNSLAHKSALSYQRISARVETCFGVLLNARNRLCRDNENVREAVVGQRFTDTLNELLLVSMISTINALVSINSFDKSETTENHAVKCLRELLAFDGNQFPSTRILQAKIAFSIHYLDAEWLYRTIESSLLNFNRMCPSTSFVVLFSSAITKSTWVKFLEWASIKKVIQLTATNAISVYKWKNVADPSFSTQLMQSEKVPNDIKTAIADTLLTKVVSDASTATNFLRMGSIVVDFIGLRCALSAGESGEGLPLIMPIQITEFSSVSSCCGSWWYQKPQFFIQLLYCFAFLEANKLSPFIFDPRTLPLKQIYSSCSDPSATSLNASVANILKDFIDRYCPEVRRTQQFIRLPSRRGVLFQNERASEKTECLYNLRKFISDHVADPCGDHAERAFVVASSRYCEADVCSMTASALLSRPHSLSPFFTYSMLYCDPLVLLKAPLHVWNRRGTRRIALHVFTSLLDINEACVRHNSTHDDVADELLKSRDGIILMTFIGILFSKSMLEQTMSSRCGMAIALIRKIVARCAGLVALLIKQGLSESELDWLIVAVPEVFDSVALKNILSDRSSLTASERLMAADGILRISIAHGYKSASDSETLTYLALAQLLSCFFLIVGPVGVPVNALISESTGLDATQVSRKAAFRILSALQSIRWYNKRLTNESVMTLQKFAGMCKGESIVGSLPAGIAAKQKTILKELLEAIAKALDATTG